MNYVFFSHDMTLGINHLTFKGVICFFLRTRKCYS